MNPLSADFKNKGSYIKNVCQANLDNLLSGIYKTVDFFFFLYAFFKGYAPVTLSSVLIFILSVL